MKLLSYYTFILIVSSCYFQSCTQKPSDTGTNNGQAAKQSAAKVTTGSQDKRTILFFGNSLTAGYGVEPTEAFPALIQEKIDSLALPYKVVNAGLSGETSAGGKSRIGWVLRQPADIFVLELGANDGLRGIDLQDTRKNLQSILDTVKAHNPQVKILITGMMIPPNMGSKYTSTFQRIFPELADANQALLIPFLLEGVAGEVKLNQADGIHPTSQGHVILAANVWKVLHPLL